MIRIAAVLATTLGLGCATYGFDEPEGLLNRFLGRVNGELERLPDYACAQTVERFTRSTAERSWEKVDTLRFEVALVGNRELYARAGARRFDDRPLADLVGRGVIGAGQHGLMAKHVFLMPPAHFTYRVEGEQEGRKTHEYTYDVPPEHSSYKLRSGSAESSVGFQGSFWIDAETLDLIRLEAQAYDIPGRLGLAEVNTSLAYSRVMVDDAEVLLPVLATLSVATVDGIESLNRTRLSECRHYRADSTILFADGPAPTERQPAPVEEIAVPKGALLELSLEANLDPTTAKIGDPVSARVSRAVRDGERTLVPQGATVRGQLVRLEKQSMPFQIHEIGLELDTLEFGGRSVKLFITMEEAGPATGLVHQAKRLDPKFTRRRTASMDILVREVQRGQGILLWDARRTPIPRGLRMKWRVQEPSSH